MTKLDEGSRCGRLGMPVVPAHITAALDELSGERMAVGQMADDTAAQRAVRAARIALIDARRAGWWDVLARWSYRAGIPDVYGRAVYAARSGARASARRWRDSAVYWRDLAERGEQS